MDAIIDRDNGIIFPFLGDEKERIKLDYQELIAQAFQAREAAYAPYSGFRVGAALLSEDGSIDTGCNIENASFTPTNCAERTAFFEAVKRGKRSFRAIAVVGAPGEEKPPFALCAPCGVCLQVMLEFCDPAVFDVVLVKDRKDYEVHKLCELIPFGFTSSNL